MAKPNDKFLTIVIVVLSIGGLLYFGLSAIQETNTPSQTNPFEYDIENFKADGSDLVTFEEVITIPLEMTPTALAIDSRDRFYIAGDQDIEQFDAEGELLSVFNTGVDVTALDVDANGSIYASTESNVLVFDSTGTKISQWPNLGENAILTSIAIADSDVYLADAGQQIVWRFSKAGQLLNRVGEEDESKDIPGFIIPSPYFDVAVDSDGYVWAANTGRHQLENYLPDGSLRTSWSRTSMRVDGFSGCCNPTHFTILPDASFVTTEKGIPRIKIHNQLGDFVTMVASAQQFDEDTEGLDVAVDSKERVVVIDPSRKQLRIFQTISEEAS